MSTDVAVEREAYKASAARADSLAGMGTLVRFALRRDRTRIPVWLGGLTLGTVATALSFADLYTSEQARNNAARSLSTPAGLAMTGPREYLADYNYGSMLAHQMIAFMAVLVGLMSILLLVRYTRAEEESGRAELVRAGVVGRHAHLAAALTVVTGTNLALAGLLAVSLGGLGLEGITWSGSVLYGATHAAVGIVFAGVAAVTVQITEYSRGATGLALAVIGLAYALRAAGDIGDGTLSWLSPIGWAQATYVYVDDRWWPLLIAVAATVVLVLVAFWLSTRRDVGAGLRRPRAGTSGASTTLTRPLGFALRLHRAMLIAFVAALFVLGTMYGSVLDQVENMIADVEVLRTMLAELGGRSMAESFTSVIMVVLSIIASVYVVLAVLKMRSEESAGRAEPVLATGLSRSRWMTSHLTVALFGGALVLLSAGLGLGLAGAATLGDSGFALTALGASLAYVPALWVTTGIAAALFGWLPRLTVGAWLVVVYAFLVGYLGQILRFPGWTNDLSPFGHVPQIPAAEFTATPIVLLTVVAIALLGFGVAGFRRRDLEAA